MQSVKIVGESEEAVIVGGYGVVFGGSDLEGETFTPETDFDLDLVPVKPVFYDHTQNGTVKTARLGSVVKQTVDDVGLWIEAELTKSSEYLTAVLELVNRGVIGWSSGTAAHLARRDGNVIKSWPIIEFSLTPTPAEPRTIGVERLKAIPELASAPEVAQESDGERAEEGNRISNIEILESETMAEQTEAVQNNDVLSAQMKALSERFEQLITVVENATPLRDAGYVAPDSEGDAANVKSLGDFAVAVRRGNIKRLQTVYGATKAHDSRTGESLGYMIPEEFRLDLRRTINLTSGVASLVNPMPVSAPSGRMPIPDYSVTPGTGESAEAGGVGVNARAEGGAYTEETGKLEQLRWMVTDALSGYVKASKELSQFAPAVEALLRRYIGTAQGSKLEYFILRGSGANEPLGILNWAGAIGITPDTNSVFAVADADEMLSRFLQTGARPVWIIHPGIIPDIAGMERGTGAGAFQSDIAQALSTTLHGFPIIRSQHLPLADASGCVILADLSMYTLFEYGGMYLDYSQHADFLNGNDVWRFGQLVDGKPEMTAAVTLPGSYTVSPFVYFND